MRSQKKKDAVRLERMWHRLRSKRRGYHDRWSIEGVEANVMVEMEIRFAHNMAEIELIRGRFRLIAEGMGVAMPEDL